jgi:hypothetical protein
VAEKVNAYTIVSKPEGRSPFGIPERRRDDNIKVDLKDIGYEVVDWINVAQDRIQRIFGFHKRRRVS